MKKFLSLFLAVIMTVMMIPAFILASSADVSDGEAPNTDCDENATGVSLAVSDIDADGYISVSLGIKNGIGTSIVLLTFEYDTDALTYDSYENGDDAAQLANCKSDGNNSNISAVNDNNAASGEIIYAYAFATSLLTSEEYSADAARGKTVSVNSDDFTLITFYFKVNEAKLPAEISVSGTFDSVK